MAKETVPTVAPRNDPKPLEPYAKSLSTQVAGARPGFVQHWFRPDQLSGLKSKLNPHEIGNDHTGYFMVDGWTVVDTKDVKLERGMDSAGKPLDTKVTNGELILCETTAENHSKYALIEEKNDKLIDKRLAGGERHNLGGRTTFKTRTMGGRDSLDASANDILQGV